MIYRYAESRTGAKTDSRLQTPTAALPPEAVHIQVRKTGFWKHHKARQRNPMPIEVFPDERVLRQTKRARGRHGRRMVVKRGFASGMVHLPLARDCWRRLRRYSRRSSRCRCSDVDELAPAGAERLTALAACHRPTGIALPVSLRRRWGRRCKTRARSPVAPLPGICSLPYPSFSRDTS
jgi:hypothetical protein